MAKIEYEFGERIKEDSKLSYLFDDEDTNNKNRHGFFLCECGVIRSIRISSVKGGDTMSCGCEAARRASKRLLKHGLSKHPLACTYFDMCKRCYSTKRKDYKHYGGRGIRVCDRWLGDDGLKNFIEDVGDKPVGLELDRRDVNKDYEPSNVQWADRSNQCYNKRVQTSNKSGRVGVYWHGQSKRWRADITCSGKRMTLGNHGSFEDAVKAREAAEMLHFGYTPNY